MKLPAPAPARPASSRRAQRWRLARLLQVVAVLVAVAVLLIGRAAFAFVPPAIEGHVTDKAFKLGGEDDRILERQLEGIRQATGNEIAVLLVPSVGDETIEDIAFATFNAWKLGQKGADNGVLLVIAPGERKVRIETGKGAGGGITDLQANDIIRNVIGPLLKQDRFREAIAAGADAIDKALREGGVVGKVPGAKKSDGKLPLPVVVGILVILFVFWLARRGGGGRGGGGGGGGDSGGGGFTGGGGESGGGGSSDDY